MEISENPANKMRDALHVPLPAVDIDRRGILGMATIMANRNFDTVVQPERCSFKVVEIIDPLRDLGSS